MNNSSCQTRQDTTERILENRWAKASPAPQRPKCHTRRIRGVASHWLYCPSPRPGQDHTKQLPLSLRFFQWERSPGPTCSLPGIEVTSWGPTLVVPHRNCRGTLWGMGTGDLIVMEKGGGAGANQHSDLGRLSSYLQCPRSSPNHCSSLTRESVGCRSA